MDNNNQKRDFQEVTQRFCPNLNDNAIIVRSVKSGVESFNCLSSSGCQNCNDCEHHKK